MNVAIDSKSSVEVKTLVVLVIRVFVRSPNEKLFDLAQNHPKLFLGKSSDIDTKTAHESEAVGKKKGANTSESKHKSKSFIASAFAHAHVKPKKTPEKSNEVKEVTESKVSSRINSKSDTLIRSDQDIDPSYKQKSTKTTKKR